MLANQMTEDDHVNLKEEFKAMDKNGDGNIDLEELTNFIINTGIEPEEANRRASSLMLELDQNGDEKISMEEFADARLSLQLQDKDLIKSQFSLIDTDGDGFITHEELAKLFNFTLSRELIVSMIKEIDKNNDGVISYEEFEKAMMKGAITNVFSPRKKMKHEIAGLMKELDKEE